MRNHRTVGSLFRESLKSLIAALHATLRSLHKLRWVEKRANVFIVSTYLPNINWDSSNKYFLVYIFNSRTRKNELLNGKLQKLYSSYMLVVCLKRCAFRQQGFHRVGIIIIPICAIIVSIIWLNFLKIKVKKKTFGRLAQALAFGRIVVVYAGSNYTTVQPNTMACKTFFFNFLIGRIFGIKISVL